MTPFLKTTSEPITGSDAISIYSCYSSILFCYKLYGLTFPYYYIIYYVNYAITEHRSNILSFCVYATIASHYDFVSCFLLNLIVVF